MSQASDTAKVIVNFTAGDFERATRMFSDQLYVDTLEELICLLESSLKARKEEMRADEEGE